MNCQPSLQFSIWLLGTFLVAAGAPTLRDAANSRDMLVSTAVRPDLFSEPAYSETLAREFNMIEPEDVMKWWVVRREPGTFDFRQGDQVVAYALAHSMKVRGHCLIWDNDNPQWLAQSHFTPAQLADLMHEHITSVMKHYASQVFAWDVVNEAFDEKGEVKDSIWYNRPGIGLAGKQTAYIEQAFRWAREADPHALLFYNEGGAESLNRKSDAVYAMLKDFKQRAVPIDGVGLQMHISHLDFAPRGNIGQHCTPRRVRPAGSHHGTGRRFAHGFDGAGSNRRSAKASRGLPRRSQGLHAKPGVHCHSDLGIHRQILLDRFAFPRHSRCCAAVRSLLPLEAGLHRHARGTFREKSSRHFAPALTKFAPVRTLQPSRICPHL
jgi:hypothetical protein